MPIHIACPLCVCPCLEPLPSQAPASERRRQRPSQKERRRAQKAREKALEREEELHWRSVEEELAAAEQEEVDEAAAQIQYLEELMVINQAELDDYCSDAAIRARAA
eukprot:3409883-Heterocapsa_arctica.AAC.1